MFAVPSHSAQIPPQDDPPAFGRYMPGLDGLRGIAIFAVMTLHFSFWYLSALSTTPLGRLYIKVTGNGWMGVDLFFVLSGFLITGILLDARGSPHFFRNFYARRTLRIFPLYYGVLVVVFLILPHTSLGPPGYASARPYQWWYWLYGANFAVYKYGWSAPDPYPLILTHLWSLAVEEHFYLVWPLIVYFSSRRGLILISGLFVLSSLAFRHWVMHHHISPEASLLTPCRTNALAIGGLLAMAFRTYSARQILSFLRPVGLCAALLLFRHQISAGRLRLNFLGIFDSTALAVCCAWIVAEGALLDAKTLFMRLLVNSPLAPLGRYSYGVYVFHQLFDHIIYQSIGTRLPHLGAVPDAMLYFCIAGTIAFALGFVSFHCYEKWFLKLKVFFPAQEPAAVERTPSRAPQPAIQ